MQLDFRLMNPPSFSFETRPESLKKINSRTWDIAIIGGGITGAAVARDAALRGCSVLLLEAHDFASGTSSGSTKLIHGGLRYLENFEFKLVYQALQEREKLKKLYAPFIQDFSFVFPTYKNTPPSRWKLHLGLFLYDAFSSFHHFHQSFNQEKTIKKFSFLKKENLTGCCIYTDSFGEDYRLVIELIKSAHRHEAFCLSRMKVMNIQPGTPHKLQVLDTLKNETHALQAQFILNCSGPWSDLIRSMLKLPPTLHLAQGVHFITPHQKLPLQEAWVLTDPTLNRILFAIPWNSITYLGTTDTVVEKVEEARAHREDCEYVLRIVNKTFKTQLSPQDILHSWAAVRPLLKPPDRRPHSQISREHEIVENPPNIFHILGGKLTNHRLMAEEALNLLQNKMSISDSQTEKIPLQDKFWTKAPENHLEKTYGYDASQILKEKRIVPTMPHFISEVLWSIHSEMALTPLDFLRRRSSLYYESPTLETAQEVTKIFSREMSWDSAQEQKALEEVLQSYDWDQKGFQ